MTIPGTLPTSMSKLPFLNGGFGALDLYRKCRSRLVFAYDGGSPLNCSVPITEWYQAAARRLDRVICAQFNGVKIAVAWVDHKDKTKGKLCDIHSIRKVANGTPGRKTRLMNTPGKGRLLFGNSFFCLNHEKIAR